MAYSDYVEHTVREAGALGRMAKRPLCVVCGWSVEVGREDVLLCEGCFDPCDTVQGGLVEMAGGLRRRIQEADVMLEARKGYRRLGGEMVKK